MNHAVSILAIGTEIITGDIVNSNAQWLSQQLVDLGYDISLHMSVADDNDKIIAALDYCHTHSETILITGGLGPTSDDFTRQVVANWTNSKLVFDDNAWIDINKRLRNMGVPIAESNRQQCFFPEGAQIIPNPAGTAAAFRFLSEKGKIICLPGPPREIKAIWKDSLQSILKKEAPTKNKSLKLMRWHCIGISESRLGEIVEDALAGSKYLTGYRPHVPYVEVKVWAPTEKEVTTCKYLQQLEAAISQWVVYRQDEDIASQFIAKLPKDKRTQIIDLVTGGALTTRLDAIWSDTDLSSRLTVVTGPIVAANRPENFNVKILPTKDASTWRVEQDGKWVEFNFNRRVTEQTVQRFKKHVCEVTLAHLAQTL